MCRTMKSVVATLFCLLGVSSRAVAWVPPSVPNAASALRQPKDAAVMDGSRFVATAAVAVVLAFSPMTAMANVGVPSSTIQVAEAIKELDFSLPSYDEVKSYKASVETVKSLSTTPVTKASDINKRTSAPKETDDAKGGFSVSTFLPSVGKQGPKTSTSSQGYNF